MSEADFGLRDLGSVIQPCPLKQPRHWIEIELVGEDDKPIPFLEYRVKLPDSRVVTGYLDREGFARLDGLTQAGTCQVCFPELDQDAWAFVETFGAPKAGNPGVS